MIQREGMGYLLKICWSIESVRWDEEKTSGKLAYQKSFLRPTIRRKPYMSKKRSVLRMLHGGTSGQFGESQTPRKTKFFEVAWTKLFQDTFGYGFRHFLIAFFAGMQMIPTIVNWKKGTWIVRIAESFVKIDTAIYQISSTHPIIKFIS